MAKNPQEEKSQRKSRVLDERELVSYVEEKLTHCQKDAYELQGYLNISYFAGKQWVTLDQPTKKIIEPPKESWQVRYVANKIQPIVRTEMAKLTKNRTIMFVSPATNEDSDIKAARIAEKVIEWAEYELDLQKKDRECCLWGLTTAVGFIKPYWNPSKGLEVEPGTHQGDIDATVVSLFELKWDTSASKWEDLTWICHCKIRTVDYIKQTYNVEVAPEGGIVMTNLYEARLQSLNTLSEGVQYKSADNSAVVNEYWELPGPEYPKGRRITVAGGKVLFYDEDIGFGPNDDTERELPFFPFFNIQVPGRVIPTCVTEQVVPIQREYNKSRSQIIENKNLMSNPMWLVPQGSLDDDPTNMPGGVLEYNAGAGKPEIVTMSSMGADVYKNLEFCDAEFEFVSGQHETSHGTTPTGVTSGTAISYLQEQDDTRLGPTIANFVDYKQAYTRYLLKMVQKKYDVERTVRLVGANQKTETLTFSGADITSIDVRVQQGSMYQLTRAAKQDWIIKLVESGVLNAQADRALILKMLELGITDDLYDEYELDVSQAQNENDKWARGDMSPIVRDFYRHDVHVKEHDKFRKEDIYNDMPPELQAMVDAHVKEHLAYVLGAVVPSAQGTPTGTPTEQPSATTP